MSTPDTADRRRPPVLVVVTLLTALLTFLLIAFAWLPWYPIFAMLLIAVSVAVIWPLTAHGRDLART